MPFVIYFRIDKWPISLSRYSDIVRAYSYASYISHTCM